MGQQAHSFACHPREGGDSHFFSTREGLDIDVTLFVDALLPLLYEKILCPLFSTREGWDNNITSFIVAFQVTAFGRNP